MANIPRWFTTSIGQVQISGGFTITITTDVACHLWLFWTDKVPWVHPISTIQRGLAVPWNAYWCYVAWHIIDQNEAGDTYIHTYTWTGWEICQTKYFRFHGDIASVTSPSDSPIYQKHYSYVPPPPEVNFPPYDPLTRDGNVNWFGQPFEAPATATPSTLYIWLYIYATMGRGVFVFIEETYAAADFWLPYTDQTGHKKGEFEIVPAVLNAHIGAYFEYTCPLIDTSPLVAGTWYSITCYDSYTARSYRYMVRGEDSLIEPETFHYAAAAGYTTRTWVIYPVRLRTKACRLTF